MENITNEELEKMRYPIGDFIYEPGADIKPLIKTIKNLPVKLRKEVENLTEEQLNTSYRPGGWTIRQVVNHIGDSHLNAYIRVKLALTEDVPTVKTYFEDRWAESIDYKITPIDESLKLVEGLHSRWSLLLEHLTPDELKKEFYHPENKINYTIEKIIAIYAWHSEHHLAQITSLKKRNGW